MLSYMPEPERARTQRPLVFFLNGRAGPFSCFLCRKLRCVVRGMKMSGRKDDRRNSGKIIRQKHFRQPQGKNAEALGHNRLNILRVTFLQVIKLFLTSWSTAPASTLLIVAEAAAARARSALVRRAKRLDWLVSVVPPVQAVASVRSSLGGAGVPP